MATDTSASPFDVIRRATDGSDDEEFERFLQARLTLFVRAMMLLVAALYVGGVGLFALFLPDQFWAVHMHPTKMLNVLLALVLFGLWMFLRRAPRPSWVLRTLDLGTAWTIAACLGVALTTAPPRYLLEGAALLLLVAVLILRAAIVPSTAQLSFIAGAGCAPPMVLGSYLQRSSQAVEGFFAPAIVAGGMLIWCTVVTFGSAMVSREIYGLVAQVRKAMQLGRYTLRDKIGEGGMGAVYRADHAMLRRSTAIKLLLPDRLSADALRRFEREVQLTSQLSHPNTIAIHDYGRTPQGVFYYAMEYLDGRSLDRLIEEEGAQPPGRVVHISIQVAGSLREAHAAGMIHRDVKPGNLLIGRYGGLHDFVKVIDFGLVKQLDPDLGTAVTLTHTDVIAGTPLFMAPECITRPEAIDAKVDTYAFGATAYYLITGRPVFEGRSMVEVCGHHLHSQPVAPSERLGRPVPPKLEALVLRCLAKEPAERPDDDELWRALRECQRESPWDELEVRPALAVVR
jgi:eukaryotic-like serine/threonine-protein kinase